MSFSETDCIKRVKKGDDDAFSTLVENYQTPVYNLCYRMVGSPQEAEDAAQETFWRAYKNIHRYDPKRSFATWLLSIAAHYCIDQQRRRKLSTIDLDEIIEFGPRDPTPNPENAVIGLENTEVVQEQMAQLNQKDRMVLVLRYWYEMSEEEICTTLEISKSAVKSRLHRARQHMAEQWLAAQENGAFAEGRQHEPQTI